MDLGIESLAALAGSITVGICYAKASKDTKWTSQLGLATIMGLILMGLGLTATVLKIKGAGL